MIDTNKDWREVLAAFRKRYEALEAITEKILYDITGKDEDSHTPGATALQYFDSLETKELLVNYITDPEGICDREKKIALISLVRMCTKENNAFEKQLQKSKIT